MRIVAGVLTQKNVRAEESTAEGISIFEYDPKGKVALAYQSLTDEVLANE